MERGARRGKVSIITGAFNVVKVAPKRVNAAITNSTKVGLGSHVIVKSQNIVELEALCCTVALNVDVATRTKRCAITRSKAGA